MATTTIINGRVTAVPQASASVDANGLETPSPNSTGVVAILGTAAGGAPLTVEQANDVSSANALRQQYQSGELRTAGLFAFAPSSDRAIPEGAAKIVPVKVNPSTQSTATLQDVDTLDSINLVSQDYGLRENQITIEVEAGTLSGKLFTVTREEDIEVFDNVGGSSVLDVEYTPGADGYDTMTGQILVTGFRAEATKADTGLGAEMTATTPAGFPSTVRLASADGTDTQLATVYGLVGAVAAQETLSLAGTTPVTTTQTFAKVLGVVLSAVPTGVVTVDDGTNTICTLTGVLSRGVVLTANTPAAGVATVSIDANAAFDAAIFGRSAGGAAVGEVFDMTLGTTPVVGSVTFGSISVIALGDFVVGRTITVAIDAISALVTEQTTGQQLEDYLNALPGVAATALMSSPRSFLTSQFDYSALASMVGAALSFTADLQAALDALGGSILVTATRASGAAKGPDNTGGPWFLQGAIEGVTTITQWQAAFDLLRCRDVNIVVTLSADPAVQALAVQHMVERSGRFARQAGEANGYLGVSQADGSVDTLANIRSAVRILQGRHMCFLPQPIERADPDTGVLTVYPPYMHAAIAAGMQAGSALAEPLTRKRPFVTDVFDGPDWTVEDDIETLIQSGLMVAEKSDKGIKYVRSVTGYLESDNLAFVEMSMNEALNSFVKGLREYIDQRMIGTRGVSGTAQAIYALAEDYSDRQKGVSINAWRALTVVQSLDSFETALEASPIGPVNFVPIRVTVTRTTQSA